MGMLVIAGLTDSGRKREVNEDSFVIGGMIENRGALSCEVPLDASFIQRYGVLAAVADGIGGHSAGNVASNLALNIISRELSLTDKAMTGQDAIYNILNNSVVLASKTIYDMSLGSADLSGMGTTVAGLYFFRDTVYTFHAGDSRIYRIRHGGLLRMTKDHSYIQTLIDLGNISEEDAKTHPQRHRIANYLGGGIDACQLEITDRFGFFEGDLFLVCSDGLTEMLEDSQILEILKNKSPVGEKANMLICAANESGGDDNITVLLVEVKAR